MSLKTSLTRFVRKTKGTLPKQSDTRRVIERANAPLWHIRQIRHAQGQPAYSFLCAIVDNPELAKRFGQPKVFGRIKDMTIRQYVATIGKNKLNETQREAFRATFFGCPTEAQRRIVDGLIQKTLDEHFVETTEGWAKKRAESKAKSEKNS
jgi:hypothetical protein